MLLTKKQQERVKILVAKHTRTNMTPKPNLGDSLRNHPEDRAGAEELLASFSEEDFNDDVYGGDLKQLKILIQLL